ncbi:hypothetical protein BOTBODRAFT_376637 [Botryobasidium botryosum FD-172 SS1]|uniref:Uncharacterized protein n=1 Tax=Botryobasidium botryosum (strain FD-172 SS1) TaxID=930990 RepID=A0A067N6L9_BOTB1|nr:hypothetical protein BOTBODRAFT_376637 [Botryobasidium botryosum FD-172 SS1]
MKSRLQATLKALRFTQFSWAPDLSGCFFCALYGLLYIPIYSTSTPEQNFRFRKKVIFSRRRCRTVASFE